MYIKIRLVPDATDCNFVMNCLCFYFYPKDYILLNRMFKSAAFIMWDSWCKSSKWSCIKILKSDCLQRPIGNVSCFIHLSVAVLLGFAPQFSRQKKAAECFNSPLSLMVKWESRKMVFNFPTFFYHLERNINVFDDTSAVVTQYLVVLSVICIDPLLSSSQNFMVITDSLTRAVTDYECLTIAFRV